MRQFQWTRPFFLEAAGLSLAGVAAQLVTLIFSPLILRRYSADAFGISSLLIGISGSAGQLSCLKYDVALTAQSGEESRFSLFFSAVAATSGIAVLSWVGALLFESSARYAIFTAATVGAVGFYTAESAWVLKNENPAMLGRAMILRAGLQAVLQLLFSSARDQAAALLAAYLFSYLGGAALLMMESHFSVSEISPRIFETAWKFREYPLLLLPGALLFDLGLWLHQATVLSYDAGSLGCYAMVHRLLVAPMAVVASAVGHLFLRWITTLPSEERRALYDRVSLLMLSLGGGICLILYPAAQLIPLLFGMHWSGAVEILRKVLPFYALRFAIAPLASGLIASGHHRALVGWQIGTLLMTLAVDEITVRRELPLLTYLGIYGFLMSLCYLLLWSWGREAIKRRGDAG